MGDRRLTNWHSPLQPLLPQTQVVAIATSHSGSKLTSLWANERPDMWVEFEAEVMMTTMMALYKLLRLLKGTLRGRVRDRTGHFLDFKFLWSIAATHRSVHFNFKNKSIREYQYQIQDRILHRLKLFRFFASAVSKLFIFLQKKDTFSG